MPLIENDFGRTTLTFGNAGTDQNVVTLVTIVAKNAKMKTYSRALRWCATGLTLTLIMWGSVSFVEIIQITRLNTDAARIVYVHINRNEFGHRPSAYRWYLDPRNTYRPADDSWMDNGRK